MKSTVGKRELMASAGRGFTLLELLVVLVILGLLAAYVGPRYFAQIGRGEATVAKTQLQGLVRALDTYRLDMGVYPTTAQGLRALSQDPGGGARWNGPYLQKEAPVDPWGRAYVYRSPGSSGRDYDLLSYGKDGTPGGDKDNGDISN